MAEQLNITRRAALVGALAIAAVEAAPVSAREPTLKDLLFAHDVATANLHLACNLADETHPQYDPAFSGFDDASDAEEQARLAVLSFPCCSLADVRLKALHFVKRLSPDCGDFADEWAGKALIQSLLGVGP